jgi:hypothetical protein
VIRLEVLAKIDAPPLDPEVEREFALRTPAEREGYASDEQIVTAAVILVNTKMAELKQELQRQYPNRLIDVRWQSHE